MTGTGAGQSGAIKVRSAWRAVAAGLVLVLSLPAAAQTPRSADPSVSVDWSVLEGLGPRPTVPGALLRRPGDPNYGRMPSQEPVVLTPPRKAAPAARTRTPAPAKAAAPKAAPTRKAAARSTPAPKAATSAAATPTAATPRTPPIVAPPPPRIAAPSPPPASAPPPPPQRVVVPAPAPASSPATATATPPPASRPAAPPPSAAAVPPPPPPAAATPSRAPAAVAALPPAQTGDGNWRFSFAANDAGLSAEARLRLDRLAETMNRDAENRLQLLAYASGDAENASQARRLSLSRALAVRSYLIEKGVRSARIDVRALGNRNEGGPPDRVDATIQAP
ncbi:MAG: OmpA family protein [Rhodospirillales bacterium]